MARTPISYEAVCAYVGELFLQTRHEIELAKSREGELVAKLTATEGERDQAVAALVNRS